jgi:hypothetical protein
MHFYRRARLFVPSIHLEHTRLGFHHPDDDGEKVMKPIECPGAVAAPGASEIDGLGRHVVSQTSRQQQLPQAPICTTFVGSVGCAVSTIMRARDHTPSAKLAHEQRRAEAADAREFQQIQKFVAACRRQWPGAIIVLRPDSARPRANAPINQNAPPGEHGRAAAPPIDRPFEEAGTK